MSPQVRHLSRRSTVSTLALAAVAATGPVALAQQGTTAARDTTHAQTQAPFFTEKDAILGATFVVGTIAMFPLDKRAAERLQDPGTQANRFFKHASTGVELIASPGAYFIGGTLYLVGLAGGWDRVADLGWHGTEAVLVGDGVTYLIKGLAGRQRPFLSNGENPHVFRFGKGFSTGDYSSFPSGHTMTAFAAAAAVTNETTRWWPRSEWYIGPLMYAGATTVGLSRMYHSRHWGSDVVLGAAIGTFAGRKVVQYQHGHPGNVIDRIMLRTKVVPNGQGGTMIMTSLPWP